MTENDIQRDQFGDDFQWGVATAAFQTEGGCNADGKGPSIWDRFTAKKGKIRNGDHARQACEFYSDFKRDIDLVKALNIPNFRFSISWSRLMPEGVPPVNQAGVDFYSRVIDYCLEQGVEPWITLYHWDLPQALEDRGGWTNREVVGWFAGFARLCAERYGDRVGHWMVMNEPVVFTGAGYFLGVHAPGRRGLKNFLSAVHHTALSMAEGGRVLRSILPDAQIGTTFSCSPVEARSQRRRDIAATRRADALINRLFIEPLLGMGYPEQDLPVLKRLRRYFRDGDEERLSFDFDFIGLQNYTREVVAHSWLTPYLQAKIVSARTRKVELTEMGWEVYPPSIYDAIRQFNRYPRIRKIIITENGAAFPDLPVEDQDGHIVVNDEQRRSYLQAHIAQVLKAKQEGMKVSGYFVWTLTDNFEWAEGFRPRFGLVYVDFQTQRRIIKSSGHWFSDFLSFKA
jgi:beta-glucosidase